ncbi:hypothetical protein B0H34DRAFT_805382 [Crassisporium funariophilum]|nr:hypothetical protein B0H34DRAFT_805382 [Crassisporium funariophilum]
MNDHQTFLLLSFALGIYATFISPINPNLTFVVDVVETIKTLVTTVISTTQYIRRRSAIPDIEQANSVELTIVHAPEHHTTPSLSPNAIPIDSQTATPPAAAGLSAFQAVRDFAVRVVSQDLQPCKININNLKAVPVILTENLVKNRHNIPTSLQSQLGTLFPDHTSRDFAISAIIILQTVLVCIVPTLCGEAAALPLDEAVPTLVTTIDIALRLRSGPAQPQRRALWYLRRGRWPSRANVSNQRADIERGDERDQEALDVFVQTERMWLAEAAKVLAEGILRSVQRPLPQQSDGGVEVGGEEM